jgi:hypothetical protein
MYKYFVGFLVPPLFALENYKKQYYTMQVSLYFYIYSKCTLIKFNKLPPFTEIYIYILQLLSDANNL